MCAAHLPVIVWRAKWMPHCELCVVRHSFTTYPIGYVPAFRILFIRCLIKRCFYCRTPCRKVLLALKIARNLRLVLFLKWSKKNPLCRKFFIFSSAVNVTTIDFVIFFRDLCYRVCLTWCSFPISPQGFCAPHTSQTNILLRQNDEVHGNKTSSKIKNFPLRFFLETKRFSGKCSSGVKIMPNVLRPCAVFC